jgi:hypothetical protein
MLHIAPFADHVLILVVAFHHDVGMKKRELFSALVTTDFQSPA